MLSECSFQDNIPYLVPNISQSIFEITVRCIPKCLFLILFLFPISKTNQTINTYTIKMFRQSLLAACNFKILQQFVCLTGNIVSVQTEAY
jgi:hypothetical protein